MISLKNMHRAVGKVGISWLLLALAAFSTAAFAQAGYVHQISGNVSIKKPGEAARLAKTGDLFESATVVRTGADGKVTLKFADGQIVAMGPDSSLRIGQYRYDAANLRQSASTVELIKGQMRFIAGLIGTANREAVRIVAGDSMISIEKSGGVDFTVAVIPGPQETGYTVVAQGEISVRTPYGPISRVADNQYAPWRPGRELPLPVPAAAAPAVVQAATAGLWASILPANTPISVASAARTAVAVATVGPALAAAGAEPVLAGYVEETSNRVSVKTASGGTATARAGTTFAAGATFDTGADGRVVLKFADGQVVVLGPSSTLAVSEYKFDPSNVKTSSASLDLVSGAMRLVTGAIHEGNPAGMNISAGGSIIDVLNARLTDFTIAVDTKAQDVGVLRVTAGEISVHTPYGAIDRTGAEQSKLWGPRATPDSPIPVATALSVVRAAVELQLLKLPDNAPVAVAPAARAVAELALANQAQAAANANPQNLQLQAAARAATELANLATQAAAAASEAVVAKLIATALDTLPPAAAGPALAQAPAQAAPAFPTALPAAPIAPSVTPGAGGGCRGSVC